MCWSILRAGSKAPKRHPSSDTGKRELFDLDWPAFLKKKKEGRSLGFEWDFVGSRKAQLWEMFKKLHRGPAPISTSAAIFETTFTTVCSMSRSLGNIHRTLWHY
jgi:hypothetical protein